MNCKKGKVGKMSVNKKKDKEKKEKKRKREKILFYDQKNLFKG